MDLKRFLQILHHYFSITLWNPIKRYPAIPSVCFCIRFYFIGVILKVNAPYFDGRPSYFEVLKTYVTVGWIPTHWNIFKLQEGSLLFKHNKDIILSRRDIYPEQYLPYNR